MADLDVPDSDERVAAILADPRTYFAEARRRAWESAGAEVAADLAARAEHRRNHARPRPTHPPTWLPANTRPQTQTD
ncbi:MAG TPA: hypothetical protein VGX25_28615 [Actinophytocola sp.]|uniref:hypothetical protein n=1 Tax=Actinophytocola sp. TaxID=1872138 RepID=UPI002DDD7C53|nr:hypothetical protein [Actinophytocola sp.]HEV2783365.1 hypothetical protein [Actinophytocola sp.]